MGSRLQSIFLATCRGVERTVVDIIHVPDTRMAFYKDLGRLPNVAVLKGGKDAVRTGPISSPSNCIRLLALADHGGFNVNLSIEGFMVSSIAPPFPAIREGLHGITGSLRSRSRFVHDQWLQGWYRGGHYHQVLLNPKTTRQLWSKLLEAASG